MAMVNVMPPSLASQAPTGARVYAGFWLATNLQEPGLPAMAMRKAPARFARSHVSVNSYIGAGTALE
ncbi:hypothetical protein UB23_27900 [Pseudomonas sp. ES3-33]|nr:hypothetical protein UB23_27900 [Pseudomonas sp. ES3-33]